MTNTVKTPATPINEVPVYKLLVGAVTIDKAILSIHNQGKKLDYDIQVAAMSAMQHQQDHGDVTLVNRLVDAMPKGSRVNALRDIILANGKVTWNESTKEFDHDKEGTFDLIGASTKMWTEYKPDPEYKPFDAAKAIKAMLAKVDALDVAKGDKCTEAQAAAIRTLAATFAG